MQLLLLYWCSQLWTHSAQTSSLVFKPALFPIMPFDFLKSRHLDSEGDGGSRRDAELFFLFWKPAKQNLTLIREEQRQGRGGGRRRRTEEDAGGRREQKHPSWRSTDKNTETKAAKISDCSVILICRQRMKLIYLFKYLSDENQTFTGWSVKTSVQHQTLVRIFTLFKFDSFHWKWRE